MKILNVKKAAFAALAAAAFTVATGVYAHGEQEHAAPRRYDPAKVEPTDFGQEGNPKKVTRTIKVDMADNMRFTPADITLRRGETVKFVVTNSGKLLHEMVLGTNQAIKEHAELMKKFPEMEHADANMAHVKPGKAADIVWQFTKAGEFQFACLQPGHFEAGMVGKVTVK
ncbi:MAG TPA: cupredoxin family protein [Albitalea sp.]|uniref:cupredoxin domain-containing protein n=1 Tax=Piscinibacter sp. TaxID=1903157 RepID=UPI002ED0E8E2